MREPEAWRDLHLVIEFPDDEDFGDIVALMRPLKLNNVVPTLLKVTSDLYAIGTEEISV
jgi:4-cresol dehydrogenase (hydroxylating)